MSGLAAAAKSTTHETLLHWTNGASLTNLTVVSPDWLISSLKQGRLLPQHEFCLPQFLTIPACPASSGNAAPTTAGLSTNNISLKTIPHEVLTDKEAYSESPLEPLSSPTLTQEAGPSASHDVEATNRNKHITDTLDQLQAMYLQMGDQFRAQNYKKASATLKRMPHVSSVSDLEGKQGFGKSIKTSIAEILDTGSLLKLQHLKKNPRSTAITILSDIWGVGEKTAEQLYNQGYKTIEDLRSRGKHLLNRQQLIGLRCYEEFLTKMPREEVDAIYCIVSEECLKICPEAELTVCGSYRRGKAECGDVDILITPAEGTTENLPAHTLSRLLLALERRDFLTDHLSLPSGHKAFVQNSALEQIRHVQGAGGSGNGNGTSTKSLSRASHAGTARSSSSSKVSQYTSQSQSSPYSQRAHQNGPSQPGLLGLSGLLELTDIPEAGSDMELELSDDEDLPSGSGSDESGAESDREALSQDGGDGDGTQSEDGAQGEEDEQSVKYDTYGGKRKKTTHRLYFGSRSSYMGVCKIPRPDALHRRIDIKIYPRSQRAFALFYFTGSDSFNRGVRYYVSKNGYALDDKGLMRCVRDEKNKIVTRGELIPCATERDIFERLGLAYKEPWDRPLFDHKTMILRPLSDNPKGNWYGNGLGNGKGYRFGLRPKDNGSSVDNTAATNNGGGAGNNSGGVRADQPQVHVNNSAGLPAAGVSTGDAVAVKPVRSELGKRPHDLETDM